MAINEYLETLGLAPGASEQDIKTAYRQLAKEYHPDISKDNYAKQQFIKITEAYKFLTEVGAKPHNEGIKYNYDPQKAEYEEWRKKARAYARQKAAEEAEHQRTILDKLYRYFNIAAVLIILFNLVIVLDYYLPTESHRKEILYATQLFYSDGTGGRVHKYDQLAFDDFKLRVKPEGAREIQMDFATIITTPIFNTIKEVKLQVEDGERALIPFNRLYTIIKFLIPLALFFIIAYYFLKNWQYNKLTLVIISSILFLIEIFLVLRYNV
ncbi:MAG: J domain-containing protein [Candidatus Cyclobacteriaceae bacterium M2_1C_046]